MPVMMLSMMFATTGSFHRRTGIDVCTSCVRMMQTATKRQVHGDSHQESNAE
jgi:hypothetical protein